MEKLKARHKTQVLEHIENICMLTVGLPAPTGTGPAAVMVKEIIAAINKALEAEARR